MVEDAQCPVQLLQHNDPGQLMGESETGQGKDIISMTQNRIRQAKGTPYQKGKITLPN